MSVSVSIRLDLSEPGLRYAQRRGGRKMHVVTDYGRDRVSAVALCGMTPDARGYWQMTSNVPLGHLCGHCRRAAPFSEKPGLRAGEEP